MYYCFIVLLHGPVLLFNVWVAQGFQEVMGKKFFQLIETKFDSVLSPMGGYVQLNSVFHGLDCVNSNCCCLHALEQLA